MTTPWKHDGVRVIGADSLDANTAQTPGMDGLATLKALRERPATETIPVVFLTASVQTSERQILLDAGATGVLAKPFDPMTLHRVVAQALGWSD